MQLQFTILDSVVPEAPYIFPLYHSMLMAVKVQSSVYNDLLLILVFKCHQTHSFLSYCTCYGINQVAVSQFIVSPCFSLHLVSFVTFFSETRWDSIFYLHVAAAVIASPLAEARSSLGTELFTKMAVELKPHPVVNFIGRRITNNNGQRTLDLKKRIYMSQICISVLVSHSM